MISFDSLANILGRALRTVKRLSLSATSILQHQQAVHILQCHLNRQLFGRLRSLSYVPEDQVPRAGQLIEQLLERSAYTLNTLRLQVNLQSVLQRSWDCPFLQVRL
jgi:hypothetical protein